MKEVYLYQFGLENDDMSGYLLQQPDFIPIKLEPLGSVPESPHLNIPNKNALIEVIRRLQKQYPEGIGCSVHCAHLEEGLFRIQMAHGFSDRQKLARQVD
jgi:hypothetical protein